MKMLEIESGVEALSGLCFHKDWDIVREKFLDICNKIDPADIINSAIIESFFSSEMNSWRVVSKNEVVISGVNDTTLSLYLFNKESYQNLLTSSENTIFFFLEKICLVDVFSIVRTDEKVTTLVRDGAIDLPKGGILKVDADDTVIKYSDDHIVPAISLRKRKKDNYNYEFDSEKLSVISVSAVYPMITQLKAAIDLIGCYGDKRYLSDLSLMLNYKHDPTVRWDALRAISKISGSEAIEALKVLVCDEDKSIAKLAQHHLDRIAKYD